MSDYKAAKEAFVADNPGASIFSINAVSLVALTSYTLYAVVSHRIHPSPIYDFFTIVLPLLIAVTIASNRPIALNVFLVALTALISWTEPRSRPVSQLNDYGAFKAKSKGKWLDESDSDEEVAVPTSSTRTTNGTIVKLPSEVVRTASSTALSPSPSPVDSSPTLSASTYGSRRRRHSPTPSTHSHTAIDVLPTPELRGSSSLDNSSSEYPSPVVRGLDRIPAPQLSFLSVYRSHMMVMTIHCILAVDFPVFPRWQGKCEDFGTSLVSFVVMDVGVGSFVFSLGIVSVRSLATSTSSGKPGNILREASIALRKAAPVLLLGIVRVVMVKGSEYPEHVTEYGVHWNFFFTLGLLPVLGTLLQPLRQKYMRWTFLGLLISSLHQIALSTTAVQSWTLSATRIGLISQNKEGLVSLPGYFAIYALGLATGEHIIRSAEPTKGKQSDVEIKRLQEKSRTDLALELFGYGVAWWAALAVWRYSGGAMSRRLANLPYVLWVAAYNTTFVLSYLVIDILFVPSPAVPLLLEAINANGLAVFLVANLLTGLVNLSMQTMHMDDARSMVVLVGYSAAVCAVAWMGRGLKVKV